MDGEIFYVINLSNSLLPPDLRNVYPSVIMKFLVALLLLSTLLLLGGCASSSIGASGGGKIYPDHEASVGAYGAAGGR